MNCTNCDAKMIKYDQSEGDIFARWECGLVIENGITVSECKAKKPSFIERVYEIAFGDNAINREFSQEEVLKQLREHSDRAYMYELDNM